VEAPEFESIRKEQFRADLDDATGITILHDQTRPIDDYSHVNAVMGSLAAGLVRFIRISSSH
jgi:hypothetical protein